MHSATLCPGAADGQASVAPTQSPSSSEAVLSAPCEQIKLPWSIKGRLLHSQVTTIAIREQKET